MEYNCNLTKLEAWSQMNLTTYNLVIMVSMCSSCSLHTLLSVPLLLVIACSPSLLRHTRFLLLTHILMCDILQQLIWTIKSVLVQTKGEIPATQCLFFSAAIQSCSMVDLFLSTALALDRFVAIRWPLRYEYLMCPWKKRTAVAVIWTLSAVLCGVALVVALKTIRVNFFLTRCRPHILAPCLLGTSKLILYCIVATAIVVPLCFLIILGCFCVLFWDMYSGLLLSKRACLTLSLQATQILLFSIPMIMNSYLIPGYLQSDFLDIATTIAYNLGVALIPLVYGYHSRELQQRIRQSAHSNLVNTHSYNL